MSADQQIIAAEVFRIADELISLSHQDAKGTFWITPAPDAKRKEGESIDLFNGSAGIIIFFLSLYRYQPDPRYLTLCLSAADRLLQHEDVLTPKYYTFYGGAVGILFLCVQLYKATGDHTYIKTALRLEKSYRKEIHKSVSNDLLSGRSGNLLAICHLYACCEDNELLDTIHTLIQQLIGNACIAPTGFKWDLYKNAFDSLTGFSHGASGIAFVLMEIGKYFNAPGLHYLAEQAFSYEMSYFDQEAGNWMDLRVGIDRMETIRQQFGEQLLQWPLAAFQPSMSGISSWAHGAAGCGISRLAAFKITGDMKYAEQAQDAMKYSWSYFVGQQHIDYSLCSGYGGIAAIFQQGAMILHEPSWHDKSCKIAIAAIEYYKKQQNYNSKLQQEIPDPGLFSGLAGVGYWMLGCLQSYQTDSILFPSLPDNTRKLNDYSVPAVKQTIFSKYFKDTFHQLSIHDNNAFEKVMTSSCDFHSVEKHLQEYMLQTEEGIRADFSVVFKREQQIAHLWLQFNSSLRFRQSILILKEFINECLHYSVQVWLQQTLVTVSHIDVITEQEGSEQYVIYCLDAGLQRVKISNVAALILLSCRTPMHVEALMHDWQIQYFTNQSKENVEKLMIERMKELVMAGFLTRHQRQTG